MFYKFQGTGVRTNMWVDFLFCEGVVSICISLHKVMLWRMKTCVK